MRTSRRVRKPYVMAESPKNIAEAVAAAAEDASEERDPIVVLNATDEASILQGLTEDVRDQADLERDITAQANQLMIDQEDERDQKRIDKVRGSIEKLEGQKAAQQKRLHTLANNPLIRPRCVEDIKRIQADIAALEQDIKDIEGRIAERHQYEDADNGADAGGSNKRLPNESHREFLIRTGKITPFSKILTREESRGDLADALGEAEEEAEIEELGLGKDEAEPRSHQNLRLPGFADTVDSGYSASENEFSLRPRKKRKLESATVARPRSQTPGTDSEDTFTPGKEEELDGDDDDEEEGGDNLETLNLSKTKKRFRGQVSGQEDLAGVDDGNEGLYQKRLKRWVEARSYARRRKIKQESDRDDTLEVEDDEQEEEWFKPCPDAPDHEFENGLKLPGDIFPALFDYQKTGVQWLGELYTQQVGGIVGDEMGLGKTIQIISFLASLHYSKKLTKPIIVVAPATVLRQWVNEFHRWWPPLRVSILHSSGSGMLDVNSEGRMEDAVEQYGYSKKPTKSSKSVKRVVDRVVRDGHVLVTTYAGLQTYADALIPVDWEYAVLDEGHKIRNPNTGITINCKELRTPNRVILSGTPMQNNLIELWSLFDFVFPMRLGTLVNFRQAFEVPIKLGGYANATNLQILTAQKCAETLKTAISPYLLQRLKVDVASDLPKKSEQVLFCKLTKPQRDAYETFLNSDEMSAIFNRTRQSLYGIDILRKICNHPDLVDPALKHKPGYKWGNAHKSGKMQVVKALLEMWKRFGHKTLLFSQGVQMLNILEDFVRSLDGFKYLRMDGTTSIKDRQTLVDRFNNDPDLHVFLLTTKVGGLGVNLTGANRVIIFDPDWNPSTDVQARERAWRLGQKKEVTIYRLMTAGTIEEKIYHRQIFKQFLTNKILKDPKQRQTFAMKDLYDLFTLGSADGETTETGEMFKGTEVHFEKPAETITEATTSSDGNGTMQDIVPQVIDSNQGDADKDVRGLVGVASLERFQGGEQEQPSTDESRLMEGIFARSGVHSALEHDEIINGKPKVRADPRVIEYEAKKVAAEAAAALRKAGEAARSIEPGTVTWTGEFGSAGRPINLRRGAGPSSAGILAGLANKQGLALTGSASSSRSNTPARVGTPVTKEVVKGRGFAKLIRDYIARMGGSAATQSIVTHFDHMCTTDQVRAEFKHTLQAVAVLEKGGSRMRGKWVLKEEFK